jgi:general secretion pathway protein M
MIAHLRRYQSRDLALFAAFNGVVFILVVALVLAPLLSHFSERSDEMAENAAQLAHFESILRQAKATAGQSGSANAFLPASEERVVSADLQASIKTIANNAGVNLLGIRGLPSSRLAQLRMISVGVEMEGSMTAVRDMMRNIESQVPVLFVVSASLRGSAAAGDDGPIRAELTVQGAMRERAAQDQGEGMPQ